MADLPKAHYYDEKVFPCWLPTQDQEGNPRKPIIRCACGVAIGLKLHHVHADGTVTASFFHARADQLQHDAEGYFFMHEGKRYGTEPGCGWHEHLKLLDYNLGEFPGEK